MCYGASSMQGWRVSQEDAHNHILNFDNGKSLFAVYDGHGGHEVAEYCSKYLPDYIKKNENYKCGNYEKALEDSFIGFDATLVDRKVVAELKVIAGNSEDKEDEEEELGHLCEEASMPIQQVIDKLQNVEANGHTCSEESNGEPSKPLALKNPALAGLRDGDNKKPISPFLRAKSTSVVEGSSGLNKHIRFNEEGEELKENGENSTKQEQTKTKEETTEETKPKVNGDAGLESETVKENGVSSTKEEAETEVKSEAKTENTELVNGKADCTEEKENKDTNGVAKEEVVETIVADIKGKGKGKGKGKSSMVKSSSMIIDVTEEQVMQAAKKKQKRTAYEIYSSLLKTAPESGDEDSEDSEDQEFGAAESDSDDEVDGDEINESDSELEDEDIEEEEDSEDMDEEEEDEEGVIEADFTEEPGNDSGCTAVLALVAGNKLFVANAGDSRCVVCRDGKALEMSLDHKPEDDIELERIKTAGGKVTPDGRVNGGLNLSRAIGDHAYKQNKTLPLKDQMISSQPDIKVIELDLAKDSWMILACDGIWNSMSSEEVVEYVNKKINDVPDDKLSTICEELFENCLSHDTLGDGTGCDNMTAVIVRFKPTLAECKDVVSSEGQNSESAGASSSSGSSGSSGSGSSSAGAASSSSLSAAPASSGSQEQKETSEPSKDTEAVSSSQEDSAVSSQDEAASSSTDEPAAKRVKLDATSDKK